MRIKEGWGLDKMVDKKALHQRVVTRGYTICEVLKNIEKTKKPSNNELRLASNNRRDHKRQFDYGGSGVGWEVLLSWNGHLRNSSDGTNCYEISSRTLTRDDFERGLKATIADYESEKPLHDIKTRNLAYLKSLMEKHEATPYADGEK